MKISELADLLKHTHNLILHGAPGTGKTYLAKDIAAWLHFSKQYSRLRDKEKQELSEYMKLVQFHPSYDYTDFVEGIRPVCGDSCDQIGFKPKNGVFKEFCERALINFDDSKKNSEILPQKSNLSVALDRLVKKIQNKEIVEIELRLSSRMDVIDADDKYIYMKTQKSVHDKYSFSLNNIKKLAEKYPDRTSLDAIRSVDREFKKVVSVSHPSGYWGILKKLYEVQLELNNTVNKVELSPQKSFVFIIDEINRGELSKIFGELFYSIDPGYRGTDGRVQTQYQNLVPAGDVFEKGFYIPENVYIIGTMNDIDRSVESMDFAMRRRFTFVEIKAEYTQESIFQSLDGDLKEKAISCMNALNEAISKIDGLSSAYHIGAAYFLKLKNLDNDFGLLWKYHLEPLLREYLRGQGDVEEKMKQLEQAYQQ